MKGRLEPFTLLLSFPMEYLNGKSLLSPGVFSLLSTSGVSNSSVLLFRTMIPPLALSSSSSTSYLTRPYASLWTLFPKFKGYKVRFRTCSTTCSPGKPSSKRTTVDVCRIPPIKLRLSRFVVLLGTVFTTRASYHAWSAS